MSKTILPNKSWTHDVTKIISCAYFVVVAVNNKKFLTYDHNKKLYCPGQTKHLLYILHDCMSHIYEFLNLSIPVCGLSGD